MCSYSVLVLFYNVMCKLMYFYVCVSFLSPLLTWRDVQHIIVKTSRAGHLSAPDWKTNAAGYNGTYSHACMHFSQQRIRLLRKESQYLISNSTQQNIPLNHFNATQLINFHQEHCRAYLLFVFFKSLFIYLFFTVFWTNGNQNLLF